MRVGNAGRSGFTLVEMMIIVAIIGLLATISIPNYVKARDNSVQAACINNLRQLDSALQQYALEARKAPADPVSLNDCTPYLKYSLICAAGGKTMVGSYEVTRCDVLPKCIAPRGGAAYGHVLP